MSTRGEDILDSARIVESLEEAVGDCVFVAGATARVEGVYRGAGVGRRGRFAGWVLRGRRC